MKPRTFQLITLFSLLTAILVTCVELPGDPALNPDSASVKLFALDGSEIITQGNTKQFGLRILMGRHFNTIQISSSCSVFDSTFLADTANSDTVRFSVSFPDDGPCTLSVRATMNNTTLKDRADSLPLFVIAHEQDTQPSVILSPATVHAPSQLIAGSADTLLFAVDNTSGTDHRTITLVTGSPLDPAVFSIVPTGSDTIMIAVNPSAQTATVSIGIITGNGTRSDTSWYPVTLISPESALWNSTSLDLDAVEGSPLSLDLTPYLSSANSAGIILSTDSGAISGNAWSFTPQWGCASALTASITAAKGGLTHSLTLNLTVAEGDTVKPVLSLVDESLDGKKVSSSQLSIACSATDAGAGVEGVIYTCGTQTVTGTLQGDGVYSGAVELDPAAPTQITITATDRSRRKNSSVITLTVTRDSTLLDAEPPVIATTSGPESGARVKVAAGTSAFSADDNSGVDSVWWTLNDVFMAALAVSDANTYSIAYTLPHYGENVIKLCAEDGSAGSNRGSLSITLNYNTDPTTITLAAPSTNAEGISISPTFKWTGGDDADDDGITFTVNYGLALANLTSTAAVSGKTATPASPLGYGKTYYWQVTGVSASTAYPDRIQSPVGSFSTEGSKPVISVQPQSQTKEEGQSVTFSVTATGFGTFSYQWYAGGAPVTGETGASYTIASVTTAMNNTVYQCKVTNEVGETTSMTATLTVTAKQYKVTYNENNGAQYVPVDDTRYGAGDIVTVKEADSRMVRAGCSFTGWCLDYYGRTTLYNASGANKTFTMGSQDTTLFAQWDTIRYAITYNLDGGQNNVNNPATYRVTDAIVTIGAPTKSGYTFIGWYSDINFILTANTIPSGSTGEKTFWAKWAMNTPVFTTKITNQSCPVNVGVTFNVVATGVNLSYEWQLNGVKISTATGSSYTTTNLTKTEISSSRTYKCIVTNSAGSDNCSATLSVSTVTDASNNVYHEIKLANNIWMMENLKTTKYRDGSSIAPVLQGEPWLLQNTGAYCWREGDIADKEYGAIYNLIAVQSGKLPPTGWRIATEADWTALFDAYTPCEIRTEDPQYWSYDGCLSTPSADFCGFNAMQLGMLATDGVNYVASNSSIYWWISEGKFAVSQHSMSTFNQIYNNSPVPGAGVRCVKE